MRKYTKLISIGSLALSLILLVSLTLGIFVSKNNTKYSQSNDNNVSTKNWNFFNSYSTTNGIYKNISKYIDRVDVLYLLTNFKKNYDLNKVDFDLSMINLNMIDFIKNLISKIDSFKNIDNYYIKVSYEIIDKILLIDARWALKEKIIENKSTSLYYHQFKLSLS